MAEQEQETLAGILQGMEDGSVPNSIILRIEVEEGEDGYLEPRAYWTPCPKQLGLRVTGRYEKDGPVRILSRHFNVSPDHVETALADGRLWITLPDLIDDLVRRLEAVGTSVESGITEWDERDVAGGMVGTLDAAQWHEVVLPEVSA